jgi:hypothetical protein
MYAYPKSSMKPAFQLAHAPNVSGIIASTPSSLLIAIMSVQTLLSRFLRLIAQPTNRHLVGFALIALVLMVLVGQKDSSGNRVNYTEEAIFGSNLSSLSSWFSSQQ